METDYGYFRFTGEYKEKYVKSTNTYYFYPQFERYYEVDSLKKKNYVLFEDALGKPYQLYEYTKNGGKHLYGVPNVNPTKANSGSKKYTFAYWMNKETQ